MKFKPSLPSITLGKLGNRFEMAKALARKKPEYQEFDTLSTYSRVPVSRGKVKRQLEKLIRIRHQVQMVSAPGPSVTGLGSWRLWLLGIGGRISFRVGMREEEFGLS